MSENKSSKYLKYAIGEIVLVITGILIALQINNWNENRKARNQELALLKNLKLEMEVNSILIDEYYESVKESKVSYDKLLSYTDPNYVEKKEDSLTYAVSNIFHLITFTPENAILTAAQNSNSIGLIKDQDIKKSLAQWMMLFEIVNRSDVLTNEQFNNSLVPIISNHFPLRNVTYLRSNGKIGFESKHENELEVLVRNREFENRLFRIRNFYRNKASKAKDLKTETLNLINFLSKELKN